MFLLQVYFYARYLCAPARRLRHRITPSEGEIPNHSRTNSIESPQKSPTDSIEIPNHSRTNSKEIPTQSPTPKGVSVLLSARNEAYNLECYLQSLLTQDYPLYEVIVVNDGSEDATEEVIERYRLQDSRLRTTFVPLEAHVGSTKKLALTLAAKAARYDYLLLTDADCRPESPQWISRMMQGFDNPATEIVLGYGAYYREHGEANRLTRFDTLFNGLHYLGAAICHHPYMGVGRNLAYKKSTFFEHGGFSRYMTEKAGDDDLFVNHIATAQNTAVVLSPESITWSSSKTSLRAWLQQKRRHLSVSPRYKASTQCRLTLEPATRGLFYALLIVIGVLGSPVAWMAAGVLFVARLLLQALSINISARRMGQSRFYVVDILRYDLCLPLITLYLMATQPLHRSDKW